ncbi:hypothetical protein [Janthinobacterium sp. 75]|uniref:hypothetical protein n=1 Tax=Janthinobacterium sp. 75 TaxID=2135628 RepID=UPI001063C483|nr:hypothetical protein [Janthinobacterium sp. 75]TDY35116.1 hypothetical protein C8C89_2963 [Janthinobacterium sp. 75]
MVTETHRRLALELRLAVETLIGAPSTDAFNALSKMLAALCNSGMKGWAIDLATETMCHICDRYERMGRIGLKDCEAVRLRSAMGGIDGRLPYIPVNKFDIAVAEVAAFCTSIGA